MLPKLSSVWSAALAVLAAASSVALAQQHIPVTGAPAPGNGPVPPRLNINDMQANGGPAWDLFLRSLRAMYDMAPSDQRSWFQIAGIHGKPYVEWNNAGPERSDGWRGYCPHGERIFLSWHRPYLALFEQELVKHAQRLAAEYPARWRDSYLNAAANLRIPYWDWAADLAVPQATVPRTVKVKVPNGDGLRENEMENPLATYRYPSAALEGRFGIFDEVRGRTQIIRCPAPGRYPESANNALRSRAYPEWVYDAFTTQNTFNGFATGERGFGLERIHDSIHWDGACGQQFLSLDLTAFDPLFLFHHINADRLWAHWQAIHPEAPIFNDTYRGRSRFATRENTLIDNRSPLEPFFQKSGSFHTSLSVLSYGSFGYTYPGLEFWAKSQDQMRQDAMRTINQLYGPRRGASAIKALALGGDEVTQQHQSLQRYFVKLQVDRSEVERPCSVNVYLDDHRAGSWVISQQPEGGIAQGGFTIDKAIHDTGKHQSSVEDTTKSIKNSLRVEIETRDGKRIDPGAVPSLTMELEDVDFVPPARDDEFPQYRNSHRQSVTVAEH
ncbi:tyrosinase [Purpureocillium lilacinum]|uniref:Tyrosinase n=1 Tax=Purpureocillium lilacinum TaxID=33203 RepID=A0A179HS62_PURLI|nr:tyrosinase [Purpureocillium lilacinum]OAQ82229.1 tyrosinase [Purpureocillium lilacinum]OAQ92269.1 tyrosinase [Purpureocillium lilacinum]